MSGMVLTNKEGIYAQLNKCIKNKFFKPFITIYCQNRVLDSSIFDFFLDKRGVYIQTMAVILHGSTNFFVPENSKIIVSTYKEPLEGYITSYDEVEELYRVSGQYFSFKIN